MMSRSIGSLVCLVFCVVGTSAYGQLDLLPSIPKGNISIRLDPVATGLGAPAYATFAPNDPSRLFIVEQKGTILVRENGVMQSTPALDIQNLMTAGTTTFFNPSSANDERGLLGLAFHPGFNTVGSAGFGKVYTYNSQPIPGASQTYPTFVAPNNAGTPNAQGYMNVVNEWSMSTTNPGVIDPTSRREVVSFGKQATNHNGGTIAFGKDGYLYMGLGDGGNAYDFGNSHVEPGGNGQNLSNPLGKMLRIDPLDPALTTGSADLLSTNSQYRIPVDNPFQGAGQVKEIYAYGLRNPYRFAFDRVTGDLIAADVGQGNIEEIDLIVKGGNYGWPLKEGDFNVIRTVNGGALTSGIGTRSPEGPNSSLIDPISGTLGTLQYDHQDGISITGGFVYRGTLIPELQGKYVFGDLAIRNAPPRVDGRLFYADLVTGTISEFLIPEFADKLPNGLTVHGFGEDFNGELYALATNTPSNGTGGVVFAITAVPEPSTFLMLGIGLGGLAIRRYTRQRSCRLSC